MNVVGRFWARCEANGTGRMHMKRNCVACCPKLLKLEAFSMSDFTIINPGLVLFRSDGHVRFLLSKEHNSVISV